MTSLRPLRLVAAIPLAALLCLASACKDDAPQPAPGRAAAAIAAQTSGPTDVAVTEKGFEPARIEARAGQPVTLRFTRKIENTCADAVNIQGDPIKHALPLNRAVEVTVTPKQAGEIAFACPMNMIKGAVVVLPH